MSVPKQVQIKTVDLCGGMMRPQLPTSKYNNQIKKSITLLLHSDMGIAVLAFPLVDVVKITQRCPTITDSKVI